MLDNLAFLNSEDVYRATTCCNNILNTISSIEKELNKASNWGFFDIFAKKSLFSSVVKHDKINNINNNINNLENQLMDLEKILDNSILNVNTKINISTGLKFMDIFMDNPISDIMTQNKLSNAKKDIANVKREIQILLNELNND